MLKDESLVRIESNFATRRTSPIRGSEKLPDRLLVLDMLFHIPRSEVYLVAELRQIFVG